MYWPTHEEWVIFFRWAYIILSFLCATGFVATLRVRWSKLVLGERMLRIGLVVEHIVLVYGGYVALKPPMLPPSAVAPLLTASLLMMLLGFLLWYYEDRSLDLPPLEERLNRHTQEKNDGNQNA